MLTLLEIRSEEGRPVTLADLARFSAPAVERLCRFTSSAKLIAQPYCKNDAARYLDEAQIVDSVGESTEIIEGDSNIIVFGGDKLTSGFTQEADTLAIMRLHNSHHTNESEPEQPYPIPGGVWRETERQLIWHDETKTGKTQPHNCSLVVYKKEYRHPLISVIISTYNQPVWLEKVLWGYQAQGCLNFELIIADDGSGHETHDMLGRITPLLSYPVRHVWHADDGFRKCEILNKAILASSSDYLLFSDGDCVPRVDFVQTHVDNRHSRRFLSNGYYKLDMQLSELISKEDILAGRCFDMKWLKQNGLRSTFKNNKFTAKGFKRWLLNTFTPAKASWNGHGSSAWLTDILAANGFDERMKYGGEDREFGERLVNAGIRGKQIRYSTVCIHLDHSRGYVSSEEVEKNKALRRNTRQNKVRRTPYGIYKGKAGQVEE